MFWSKDKSKKAEDKASSAKSSLEEIRAQAIENARNARAHLGDDTIQRIAELMAQKKNSVTERAKAQIQSHSIEDLTRELRALIEG